MSTPSKHTDVGEIDESRLLLDFSCAGSALHHCAGPGCGEPACCGVDPVDPRFSGRAWARATSRVEQKNTLRHLKALTRAAAAFRGPVEFTDIHEDEQPSDPAQWLASLRKNVAVAMRQHRQHQHHLRFEFTRELVREAYRRALVARHAIVVAIALAVAVTMVVVTNGSFDASIKIAVVAFGLVGIVAAPVVVTELSVARTLGLWKQQSPDHIVRYHTDDDGITVEWQRTSSRHGWTEFKRLHHHADLWVLVDRTNGLLVFPAADTSDEFKDFVLARCHAAGVATRNS